MKNILRKIFLIALMLGALSVGARAQTIDLPTQTKGVLPKSKGGTGSSTGVISSPSFNSMLWVDGTTYTTIEAAYAALPAGGGVVMVPPNFTETPAGNLTLGTAHTAIVFTGPAAITMGTHQVIVPVGIDDVGISSQVPFGDLVGGAGVYFIYTGNSNALVVGASSADTRGFKFQDVTLDLAGAGDAAIGIDLIRTQYYDMSHFDIYGSAGGSSTEIGIKLDGNGNFTGGGKIETGQITGVNIGIQLTGSGVTSANFNTIDTLAINSGVGTTPIGIDFEAQSVENVVMNAEIEGVTTAINIGNSATLGNYIIVHSEANTHDLNCGGSSGQNRIHFINGGTSVNVTGSCSANSYDVDNRSELFNDSTIYTYAKRAFTTVAVYSPGVSVNLLGSYVAPTIASGFGSGPSIPANNGTWDFTVNVGTGGSASSGVITMPSATTGWNCRVTPNGAPQAAAVTYSAPTSGTSITLTNYTLTTGATLAWTASTVLQVQCLAY